MTNDNVFLELHEQIASTRRKRDFGSEIYGVKIRLAINDNLIGAWSDLMQICSSAGDQRLVVVQAQRLLLRGSFQWHVTVTDKVNADADAESFVVPVEHLVVEADMSSGAYPLIQIKPPSLDACSKKIRATSISDLFLNSILEHNVDGLRAFLASAELDDKPFARQYVVNNLLLACLKNNEIDEVRSTLRNGFRLEDWAFKSSLRPDGQQVYLTILRELDLSLSSTSAGPTAGPRHRL